MTKNSYIYAQGETKAYFEGQDIYWMLHITMDMAYLYVITTKLSVIIS